MQQLLKYGFSKRINFIGLFFLISVFFSCSKKMNFQTSQVVPAAQGFVKTKMDKNNNYSIKLKVNHLAKPEKLTPPRKEYVVWMATEQNEIKNIGRLKSSLGTLSGSLVTVTAFKPVSFFITAEDRSDISIPGSTIILKTE